ncbi:MAG: L-threonylcarbamoyladenylate synthase [Gemmatimonadota bacterium]
MARFLELNGLRDETEWVDQVRAALAAGALLVHPTGSVYGLGGGAPDSDSTVSRMKERPSRAPIIRLVLDAPSVKRLFPDVEWSDAADALASAFWPGPLTLVLDDGTEPGRAVRAEPHPVTRAVLANWAGSLGSTSLNRSGAAAARTVHEARATLLEMADPGRLLLFLAAGDLAGSPPSTMLSLRGGRFRLVREGAVRKADLEQVVGNTIAGREEID